ncbi:MAG: M1 family peptidase, partial [Gemmatimonadota bacterium]|nr:M1 family peptidase [Gemmatimonadota bacterium]
MRYRHSLLVLAAVSFACAAPQIVREPSPPAVRTGDASPGRVRPYPVTETRGFAAAVERATRTRSGTPGPRYWQQWARYRLAAELDPASARLTGRGSVRYFNRSPDTLPDVWVHLHQNLFAP